MACDIQKQLQEPFNPDDIEWRVQRSGVSFGKVWMIIVPYVDNRAIQRRLDDVLGVFGWEDAYKPTPDGRGMLCGITIFDKKFDKSVTKWDGAEIPPELSPEDVKAGKKQKSDPIKTALSNSEKRASVKIGVGRYLYKIKEQFANCKVLEKRSDCSDNGNYQKIKQKGAEFHVEWFPPRLPAWAMPNIESDSLIENIKLAENLIELRDVFKDAYNYAISFGRDDLLPNMLKIKDLKKEELTKLVKNEGAENARKCRLWFERRVSDLIMSAGNESVLRLAKDQLTEELQVKGEEFKTDTVEMKKALIKYFNQKQLKLQTIKKG